MCTSNKITYYLHVKHLFIIYTNNCTYDIINYEHVENNSSSNSMNLMTIQNGKTRMFVDGNYASGRLNTCMYAREASVT